MNRVIKFRGKRLVTGEWVYGSYVPHYDFFGIIKDEMVGENGDLIEIENETVGQFTGLYDRNGKEIYEGDLLGSKGKVIGWVKGGVRGYCYDVVYINHPAGESDWSLYSTVKDDYPEQIEVISNIHDNPELLKGGNDEKQRSKKIFK